MGRTEENKRETIVALVKELLNEGMAKRSQIPLIKETQRNPAWIQFSLPTSDINYTFEAALKERRDKEAKAKKANERRNCYTSVRLTPLCFRDEEKSMRKITSQSLSESLIEPATKQKVDQKLDMNIEKLKSMWQLRIKWKSNPTFSTWLEVQDPTHTQLDPSGSSQDQPLGPL